VQIAVEAWRHALRTWRATSPFRMRPSLAARSCQVCRHLTHHVVSVIQVAVRTLCRSCTALAGFGGLKSHTTCYATCQGGCFKNPSADQLSGQKLMRRSKPLRVVSKRSLTSNAHVTLQPTVYWLVLRSSCELAPIEIKQNSNSCSWVSMACSTYHLLRSPRQKPSGVAGGTDAMEPGSKGGALVPGFDGAESKVPDSAAPNEARPRLQCITNSPAERVRLGTSGDLGVC
jgi:hypothetical protein